MLRRGRARAIAALAKALTVIAAITGLAFKSNRVPGLATMRLLKHHRDRLPKRAQRKVTDRHTVEQASPRIRLD